MNFYNQKLYSNLEKELLNRYETNSSFVIITLPGLGISYFLKKFLEKNKSLKIKYIDTANAELGSFNILDLDFDTNEKAISIADDYFKKAEINQKFALIINTPSVIDEDIFKKSHISKKIYFTYFFKVRDKKDTSIFAKEINKNLKEKDLDEIYNISGGIGRAIKYLSTNTDKLKLQIKELASDKNLRNVIKPLVDIVAGTKKDVLEKIGITNNNGFVSPLLSVYLQDTAPNNTFDIEITSGMVVVENGIKSAKRLLNFEASVIKEACQNNGLVTKGKMADFKWGSGSYDNYSDQAIAKTIQRLNKKLSIYQFKALPKTGYILRNK